MRERCGHDSTTFFIYVIGSKHPDRFYSLVYLVDVELFALRILPAKSPARGRHRPHRLVQGARGAAWAGEAVAPTKADFVVGKQVDESTVTAVESDSIEMAGPPILPPHAL